MDLFDREKADKLYDLLDDLYYADTQSLEKEVVYKDKNVTICFDDILMSLQTYIENNYLKVSECWNLKK